MISVRVERPSALASAFIAPNAAVSPTAATATDTSASISEKPRLEPLLTLSRLPLLAENIGDLRVDESHRALVVGVQREHRALRLELDAPAIAAPIRIEPEPPLRRG